MISFYGYKIIECKKEYLTLHLKSRNNPGHLNLGQLSSVFEGNVSPKYLPTNFLKAL